MPPTVCRARRTPAVAHALAARAVGAPVALGVQAPSALGAGACPAAFACPAAVAGLTAATAGERLADRDGDGLACRITVDRRDGTRLMALTDNEARGLIIQVAPAACTAPFREGRVSDPEHFDDPDDFPAERRPRAAAVDRNEDGQICASTTDTPGQRVLVLLDNVRPAASPRITTVPGVTATAR